jgi:hypothetical protein
MSMVTRRWALTAALATLVGGAAALVLRVGLPAGAQSWSIGPVGEGMRDRSLPSLAVGDVAPDVDLVALDRSDHVALSSLLPEGKPAVLIFGSFT